MDRFEKSLVFECAFTFMYMQQTNGTKYDFWVGRLMPLKRALDNAIGETTKFMLAYENMIYIYGARELLYKIDIGNGWEIIKL